MLTLLLGDFRSGKSKYLADCIARDVASGIPVKLIVPEQEAVSAELRFSALLPPSAPLTFEVTNFSRLANTVFRQGRACGGICGPYRSRAHHVARVAPPSARGGLFLPSGSLGCFAVFARGGRNARFRNRGCRSCRCGFAREG